MSEGILNVIERISSLFATTGLKQPFAILDILIVAILFYFIYVFVKETRAFRILLGFLVVAIVLLLSRFLGLSTLNWIIKNFMTMLIVAIPIVFQPELRAALEKLGRVKLSTEPLSKKGDIEKIVNEIISACDSLVKTESGALIVLQRRTGLKDIAETGTFLNADLSSPLLLNIFSKKAPLHDGAVIIAGDKILAASCLLPLDDSRLKEDFGARHRAALALSKQTDALIIVISEEKRNISLVSEGKITSDLSPFDLKQTLLALLKKK